MRLAKSCSASAARPQDFKLFFLAKPQSPQSKIVFAGIIKKSLRLGASRPPCELGEVGGFT